MELDLSNRPQCTRVGTAVSDRKTIMHGVPGGSVLGPLLFLVYIDYVVELCGTSMYADAMAIFFFGNDLDDVRLSIQNDMQSIAYWMQQNRLTLNVKKLS